MARPTGTITVNFKGGLNLVSTPFDMTAGEAIQLLNYEVNQTGRYQSIMGYERFDGKPAPSAVRPQDLPGWPFDTDEIEAEQVAINRAYRRSQITTLPGTGPVRGVFVFQQNVYAFRDTVAGGQSMWKATPSGWQPVTLPARNGGGYVRHVVANFKGSAGSKEVIFVDGVNKAARFDGTAVTEIEGPITPDAPTRVAVLPSQVLLLAYRNGSLVFSAVGEPTKFSPIDGGGEIGVADEIVDIQVEPNSSCSVFCRNRTYILYGKSKIDFNLTDLSLVTGAIPNSVQSLGDSVYLDDRGMTRLQRVQQFGNFAMATFSQKVQPFLNDYKGKVSASFVVKEKNQYRLCFDDGTGLIVTFFGNEVSGISSFDFNKPIRCAVSAEDDSGREVIYFGSDDGYVYQAERGFSFDGEPIVTVCRPNFYTPNPEQNFRYYWVVLETTTIGDKEITVSPEYDYADGETPKEPAQTQVISGGGGFYDQGQWDETAWSAAVNHRSKFYISGVAQNMSLLVVTSSTIAAPHVLNSMVLKLSPRGQIR